MANNKLIVEVVGDTTKLTQDLNKAQAEVKKFASSTATATSTSSRIEQVRQNLGLPQLTKEIDANAEAAKRGATSADALNRRMTGVAIKGAAAGLAINRLGANFQEFDGNIGKVGQALSDLSQHQQRLRVGERVA